MKIQEGSLLKKTPFLVAMATKTIYIFYKGGKIDKNEEKIRFCKSYRKYY